MSKKNNGGLIFGRSLTMLLVVLFSLSGLQMILTEVSRTGKGEVLGERRSARSIKNDDDDDDNHNRSGGSTTTTVTLAPTTTATVTVAVPTESPDPTETASPTETVNPTETVDQTESETSSSSTSTAAPTTTTTATTATTAAPTTTTPTTTSQESRSVGETIRSVLRQIGVSVPSPTSTPAPTLEKITVKEEVVNERTAGEILKDLRSSTSQGVQKETRLRFKGGDQGVGLVAESQSGEGTALSTSDTQKIAQTLKLGSGLVVDKGERGGLIFSRGEAKAVTGLPLLVDLESNTLTVETSLGIKIVAILPDTALTKPVLFGVLDKVSDQQITLIERDDGKIAYRIAGTVKRKMFGLVEIESGQTVDISAESGRVLPNLTDSLGATVFNILAPTVK